MAQSFPGAALSCYKPCDENHRHIASSGGGQQPKIKVSQPPKAEGEDPSFPGPGAPGVPRLVTLDLCLLLSGLRYQLLDSG